MRTDKLRRINRWIPCLAAILSTVARIPRSAMLLIGSLVFGATTGCAAMLPSPPELSRGIAKQDLSHSGRLMAEVTGQVAATIDQNDGQGAERALDLRNVISADVVRCEQRLSTSAQTMKLQRTLKSALTIAGASLSTGAGAASAILTNTQIVKEPQTVTAILAAAGGLVAILTQTIGDPSGELQNYQRSLEHYNQAVSIAELIRLSSRAQFLDSPNCDQTSTKDTPECRALKKQGESVAAIRFAAWQGTKIREM